MKQGKSPMAKWVFIVILVAMIFMMKRNYNGSYQGQIIYKLEEKEMTPEEREIAQKYRDKEYYHVSMKTKSGKDTSVHALSAINVRNLANGRAVSLEIFNKGYEIVNLGK
jgi:hypothetical protein